MDFSINSAKGLAGIRSREGALYTACGLQGYLILIFETYRLSVDIELFDRENREGVVSVFGIPAEPPLFQSALGRSSGSS